MEVFQTDRKHSHLNQFYLSKQNTKYEIPICVINHSRNWKLVHFAVPPSIVTSLPSINVIQGDDVELQCLVSGIPRPSIEWLKNGVRVNGDLHENLGLSNDAQTLTIRNTQVKSEVGTLRCAQNYETRILSFSD